jgi:hypothetical protein
MKEKPIRMTYLGSNGHDLAHVGDDGDGVWTSIKPERQDAPAPRQGMHWVLWAVIVFPCLLAAVVLAVRFCLGRPM